MVIVKFPRKPGDPAKCLYWNDDKKVEKSMSVPIEALERPEARIKREYRLKQILDGNRHITLPPEADPERTMVIAFDSVEDKMNFVNSQFQSLDPTKTKVIH